MAIFIGDLQVPMLKGDKGDQGIQGIQGVQGIPGENATIAIGTVVAGEAGDPASVVNSGTATNAILDFVLPKGNTGEVAGEDKEKLDEILDYFEGNNSLGAVLDVVNGEVINTETFVDSINGEQPPEETEETEETTEGGE